MIVECRKLKVYKVWESEEKYNKRAMGRGRKGGEDSRAQGVRR
jgi:hypothetical protein